MVSEAGERGGRVARSTRLLWALGAVVAAALIAAALVGALRDATSLPAGTPERAVQDYVGAVLDGDADEAFALLSDDLARRCSAEDFRVALPQTRLTVTLDDVAIRDDEAEVTVRLREDADEPLLPIFDSGYHQTFFLVRQDGMWAIDADPWPLTVCPTPR